MNRNKTNEEWKTRKHTLFLFAKQKQLISICALLLLCYSLVVRVAERSVWVSERESAYVCLCMRAFMCVYMLKRSVMWCYCVPAAEFGLQRRQGIQSTVSGYIYCHCSVRWLVMVLCRLFFFVWLLLLLQLMCVCFFHCSDVGLLRNFRCTFYNLFLCVFTTYYCCCLSLFSMFFVLYVNQPLSLFIIFFSFLSCRQMLALLRILQQ